MAIIAQLLHDGKVFAMCEDVSFESGNGLGYRESSGGGYEFCQVSSPWAEVKLSSPSIRDGALPESGTDVDVRLLVGTLNASGSGRLFYDSTDLLVWRSSSLLKTQ